MTASALASPALSESSVSSYKAQTKIEQSHDIFSLESNASAPSPAASTSSFATSPSPQPSHNQIHQQNHHHLQILGNHPASPVACTFLDLPEDPFMPARANILFDSEYKQEYQEPTYENENFLPYSPTEDCQSSNEYYSQRIKSEFGNDQFVSMGGVNSYMPMGRSFSDNQLSDMCESPNVMPFDSSSSLSSLSQATGAVYAGQVIYDNDYYVSAQHNLYSQQHTQGQYHHHHNYSTSSLSSISEDSSLSPRSPFSGNMPMSSSCPISPSYPLTRTMSEPSIPAFQSNDVNGSFANGTGANGSSMIKPTPKRSRGRRVSCNPDNSGCKVFTCRFDDCGKIFKRSEHLKRHVRSIHTMEKPFECPIHNCPKRFSRSDNLNQHIRIHRHNGRGDKSKSFNAFTPFNYSSELLSL
ncbi:hypothetical protein BGX21_011127 [Mortierella sp. AD011]|nr:hypothetical protein BGX20_001023 [Mortierella sp. AD010]KAF9391879.1 hypothetical protein BGX21_011127 [Mortierella sp. AD011]